jgi:DNA-binding protein HU-beta
VNKVGLVDAIARRTGLSNAHAQAVLDSVIGTVEEQLVRGDEVAIQGFGRFSVIERAARTGRNPQTGESLQINASKAPKFSAGASLKAAVNGKPKK